MIRVTNYVAIACILSAIIGGVLLLVNLENENLASLLPVIFNSIVSI